MHRWRTSINNLWTIGFILLFRRQSIQRNLESWKTRYSRVWPLQLLLQYPTQRHGNIEFVESTLTTRSWQRFAKNIAPNGNLRAEYRDKCAAPYRAAFRAIGRAFPQPSSMTNLACLLRTISQRILAISTLSWTNEKTKETKREIESTILQRMNK